MTLQSGDKPLNATSTNASEVRLPNPFDSPGTHYAVPVDGGTLFFEKKYIIKKDPFGNFLRIALWCTPTFEPCKDSK